MAISGSQIFMVGMSASTLLESCLRQMMNNLGYHVNKLGSLPPSLKDRLLYLMCKRGLVTDENIIQVLHDRVQELELRDCEVGDPGLQHVAHHCHMLRKVDLNSPKGCRVNVTTQGVVSLALSCPCLQVVYLLRCVNLTDEGVEALAQYCPNLRYLGVGGCPLLTDASLQALGQNCANLRSVDFHKARVTDSGVLGLVGGVCSNSLKEIHMNGCVALTDEAVECVLSCCPAISIFIFHGCPKITDESRIALEQMMSGPPGRMKQVTWTIY